jgi:hypothetical protein
LPNALHDAVLHGLPSVAERLLEDGADLDRQDKGKRTPPHFAAKEYGPREMLLLFVKVATNDARDIFGNTPRWGLTGAGQAMSEIHTNQGSRTISVSNSRLLTRKQIITNMVMILVIVPAAFVGTFAALNCRVSVGLIVVGILMGGTASILTYVSGGGSDDERQKKALDNRAC